MESSLFDSTTILTMLAVLALICCSFLFSGSETAVTAASRARLMSLESGGDARATLVMRLSEYKDRLIGALLIGNNLVNILASALITRLFLDLFGDQGVIYATLIMTVLLVIFAEILPKSWAVSSPEKFAMTVAPFVNLVVMAFGSLSRLANAFVRQLMGIFGIRLDENQLSYSPHEELRGAVEVMHRDGSFVKDDRDRLGGVLDLHDLEVSDVMVHRTKMISLNADDPAETIVREVLESPYTRMPIWRGTTENIIGIVHAKDVLRAMRGGDLSVSDLNAIDVTKIMTAPWFVPDTTGLKPQLNAFLKRSQHMAIVVDEYGEMEGLVTLEDILEEIVGDIADEHDIAVQGVRQESDGSIIVEGTVPIRDLNRALDWNLPDEDFNTIAGLVIHEAKTIPDEKQAFTFHGKRFVVLKRDRNRIAKLRIRSV